MLMIRPEQLKAFEQAEVEKFEKWMCAHLTRFFPRECAAAGETGLQEMVRYGIQRAAAHGITAQRDVCKYIDLMIGFGRDFDTDKRSPWAGEILAKRRSSGERMHALLQAAKISLKRR